MGDVECHGTVAPECGGAAGDGARRWFRCRRQQIDGKKMGTDGSVDAGRAHREMGKNGHQQGMDAGRQMRKRRRVEGGKKARKRCRDSREMVPLLFYVFQPYPPMDS